MAPLLPSFAEQNGFMTPARLSKRLGKPVVPAIPRVFEKRRPAISTQVPNSDSILAEQVQYSNAVDQSSASDTSVVTGDQPTPKTVPEVGAIDQDSARGRLQHSGLEETQDVLTLSTSACTQDSSTQNETFQLPPAFYSTPPYLSPTAYPIQFRQPRHYSNQTPSKLISPYGLERSIVFGGELDSNQSSPVSLPSVGSTTFTQPTPLSDASYRSQSLYQGYGHIPNAYEHTTFPKLIFNPQQSLPNQPVYAPSSESDYGNMLQQATTNLQPSPSQTFQPLSPENWYDQLQALGHYILVQFNEPLLADCVLHLEIGGEKHEFMLHGVLIAQSPTLQALIQGVKNFDQNGRKILTLFTPDPHVKMPLVFAALRSYYGAPLLAASQPVNDHETALAYLSTGRLLQLATYEDIGTSALLSSLTLENLEAALSYVGESSAYAMHERLGTLSKGDTPSAQGTEDMEAQYDRLLAGVIDFLVANFPDPFVFDYHAPTSSFLDGFPPAQHPKQQQKQQQQQQQQQQLSKPELMSIQFGDFPSANHLVPSMESKVVSSLLISMPSKLLQRVLEGLGRLVDPETTSSLVSEREKRRLAASQV